jgi:hypothetical protein
VHVSMHFVAIPRKSVQTTSILVRRVKHAPFSAFCSSVLIPSTTWTRFGHARRRGLDCSIEQQDKHTPATSISRLFMPALLSTPCASRSRPSQMPSPSKQATFIWSKNGLRAFLVSLLRVAIRFACATAIAPVVQQSYQHLQLLTKLLL